VVFVSEGFYLATPGTWLNDARPDVDHVIDTANRGGVVMYGIDPRGLVNPSMAAFTAERSGSDPSYTGTSMSIVPPSSFVASRALFETQGSLEYLAGQTGGFAVVNHNDLAGGLARIGADTRGYYLIGFDTAIPSGVRTDEGEVKIRVKRKDLEVRARRDRFGPADPDAPPPLLSAALSPFTTGTLDVRLAALFGHDTAEGDFVRAFVAVDPAGLTLAETAGGGREGNLTLLVFALGDEGDVVGKTREDIAVRLDTDAYDRARQQGLRYAVRLPFEKPGGYQIRVAVRDERSGALGASAQFVEVPRVGKDHLALSGVVLSEAHAADTSMVATFPRGSRIEYQGTLYDGRRRDSGFAVTTTALRDGKLLYTSPPAPLAAAPPDPRAVAPIPFSGTLTLGDQFTPGLYTLQVIIEPVIPGKKSRPVRQWVDFEVR
jgi:hypothetical protein